METLSAAQTGAHEWLHRMSMASHSLNYSGTFVYQHEGRLESMQILHAMDDKGERERLISLTGPRREVLRDNSLVTCVLGDSHSVVVNKSRPKVAYPTSFPRELDKIETNYQFDVVGDDRVAGMDCKVVVVQPRDHFRYGRRLCVHADSYLLLRSELTDMHGKVVEQFMFTKVQFPKTISEQELLPSLIGADFNWKRQPENSSIESAPEDISKWEITRLPRGFVLTDRTWDQLSADASVEHWIFSDGLASISVYVEQSPEEHDPYGGVSRRGALNAFGTMVANHYVTVVGEVPLATVKMIGRSVLVRE